MRTHSGKIVTASTSYGQSNTSGPPFADAVVALLNVNNDNARILQNWAQHGVPVAQNRSDSEAGNTYLYFLKTNPPIFHRAQEPLEAEDWIRTLEQKFSLIQCNNIQKTQYVVQQLQGSAGA
jgi:hypothetical protein